jgi:acyl dehydratase
VSDWYFDDFSAGQTFLTQRRTLTESDVVTFAAWSWDTNPVHTDAVHAAEGRFGERIGHGLLGMSVAMGLAARLGVFEACSVALLGVTNWRFLAPLRIGDTVQAEVVITGTRRTSSGDTGILNRHFRLHGDTGGLLQEGDIDLMVSTRPPTR